MDSSDEGSSRFRFVRGGLYLMAGTRAAVARAPSIKASVSLFDIEVSPSGQKESGRCAASAVSFNQPAVLQLTRLD